MSPEVSNNPTPDVPLALLSDMAEAAHGRIQQNFSEINLVVGVSHAMRASGIPADVMTLDCLQSNRRIILILHDQQPELIRFQFGYRDQDPQQPLQQLAFDQMSSDRLYTWMSRYFSGLEV